MTVSQLSQVFRVSKQSVRVRIETLRLIEIEDKKNSYQSIDSFNDNTKPRVTRKSILLQGFLKIFAGTTEVIHKKSGGFSQLVINIRLHR
jgi:hypothetical protein